MQVALEPFSPAQAALQAKELRSLIERNRAWLEESPYRGAVERFGAMATGAALDIAQNANTQGASDLHPFIIQESAGRRNFGLYSAARGLAMMVKNKHLCHPGTGAIVSGVGLDYWLDADLGGDREVHRQVAGILIAKARKVYIGRSRGGRPVAFTTAEPDTPYQPHGLIGMMEPVGFPAQLGLSDSAQGLGLYSMLKGGRLLQLYSTPLTTVQ